MTTAKTGITVTCDQRPQACLKLKFHGSLTDLNPCCAGSHPSPCTSTLFLVPAALLVQLQRARLAEKPTGWCLAPLAPRAGQPQEHHHSRGCEEPWPGSQQSHLRLCYGARELVTREQAYTGEVGTQVSQGPSCCGAASG